MQTVTNLEEQLARDEGKKYSAYQDGLGYWTIGIGICIDGRKGCGLTDDEILYIFNARMARNRRELSVAFPWTDALDEVRRGALLNMVYQMGLHGLGEFREFLAALQVRDYTAAAAKMLDSVWARSQSPDRAHRLSQQILTGQWT